MIHAYAAHQAGGKLEPFEYDPGPLKPGQIEIDVAYCGICHSDLAMLDNEWQWSQYPFVPGHEAAGVVAAVGDGVSNLQVGQRVGLGWMAGSCMACRQCMSGDHNLCASSEQTIVGRYGAFADKVRCQAPWALPLPEALDWSKAGPLFCGGITVFNPIVQFGVKPTDRVGVIGIGGLGHLALQFLNKWGCEVVAFTSSDSKREEAVSLGAHRTLNSRASGELEKAAGSFDFILSTVTADLDWPAYIGALAPKGRLHVVGIPEQPLAIPAFPMIGGQRSVSGSPSGSPATIASMLDFCSRHQIAPVVEEFPMSAANEAMERLKTGKARYRIVLKNG